MKVIDGTQLNQKGKPTGLFSKTRGMFQQPSVSRDEQRAQRTIISVFQGTLDNRFILMHDVFLNGPDILLPLILVGPGGVWMIYLSGARGVFRAREETWEQLNEGTRKYNIVRPNLITRSVMMARAVQTYLSQNMEDAPEVMPVLFFSNSGVHMEATRPAARIVLADGLERFAASIAQEPSALTQSEVQKVVSTLGGESLAAQQLQISPEIDDAFSLLELPPEESRAPKPLVMMDTSESKIVSKVPLNRKQLVILSLLALVNIAILVALVVYIIMLYS
jgi:hypothetical protein